MTFKFKYFHFDRVHVDSVHGMLPGASRSVKVIIVLLKLVS